jgi:hypothetical protein
MLKKFFAVAMLVSALSLVTPALFAEDQSIEFNLSAPAEIANKVLQPGKYYIRPVDTSLMNAVEVSQANGRNVGFFLVHPEDMVQAATQSTIKLDAQNAGSPARITGFVVAGAETGYDFSVDQANPQLRVASRVGHFFRHLV